MDSKISLQLLKERAKLEKLILEKAPYEIICKKSQELDNLVLIKFKALNKKYESSS